MFVTACPVSTDSGRPVGDGELKMTGKTPPIRKKHEKCGEHGRELIAGKTKKCN
jgi:hypothetical protein